LQPKDIDGILRTLAAKCDADELLTRSQEVLALRTNLTENVVKTAPIPSKGSNTIWDTDITGFGLRIFAPTRRNPGDARSFFINYRSAGIERRLTIGDFPVWSAKAAREKAKELRKQIDDGGDPARERREAREAPTVKDLAERYRREHLPRKAPSSRKADWAMIEREILPKLGHRKVADVHHGDMVALHERITVSGRPVRANRVNSVASKMFALSLKPMAGESEPWRDQAQGNPCRSIERNPEEGRERFFSTDEIAALTDALQEYGETPASNCLRLLLLTGARPGEAMRARWSEFAEAGFWDKPSAHTKQRKRHRVPLSPAATDLIEQIRRKRVDDVEFVFPGRIKGQPLRELRGCWEAVAQRAGLEGARIYDLRHSFASIGAGGGLSLQIIGKLLGHVVSRTTEKYAHLADDPLREAAAKIGSAIAGAGKGASNVVAISKRRGE
jgi:integrase